MELAFSYDTLQNGNSRAATKKEAYLKAYNAWSYEMVINRHFNIGIKHIMRKLHVSDFWIKTRLCPALDYVKVSPTRLRQLGLDDHSTLLFNEEDLRKYLASLSVFTRQTIVIDLAKIAEEKVLRAVDDNPAICKWDKQNKNSYGKRAGVLLDMLEGDYENVNETKRSEYPEVKVEPFDFWSYELKFSSAYPNRERAYRDFFLRGYIKICMFGKSVFVLKENLDEINYPLTVPYKQEKQD